jgi:hypothetical protein
LFLAIISTGTQGKPILLHVFLLGTFLPSI